MGVSGNEAKIDISDLGDEITRMCQAYINEVDDGAKKAIHAAGIESRKYLREYKTIRGLGFYGKSWRMKTTGSVFGEYEAVIYSTMPGLPHLIEFGHAGPAPAPPHPHMEQAYEAGVKVLKDWMGL